MRHQRWEELKEKQERVEKHLELERLEKEEMSKHLQQLVKENQRLKDQAAGLYPLLRSKEVEEERKEQLRRLWEENQRLKDDMRRRFISAEQTQEEELPFETPPGSSGLGGPQERPEPGLDEKEFKPEEPLPDRSGKGRSSRKKEDPEPTGDVDQQTLTVILRLVEGMQKIQDKMATGHHGEGAHDPETVRSSVELPRLAEWNCETGPIDFADWLLVLAPLMSDLSPSSEEWWGMTVEEAREWYRLRMLKSPLERLSHKAMPSMKLQQKKWSRLERRASALLLAAVPEVLKEEVVTSKCLTTFGILTKGMVTYQPGGLAERQAILSALEGPAEPSTIQGVVLTLRRWIRWKRRAEEVGVSIPDPTILVKGLNRITKRLTSTFPELYFRLQLVKSSLMVDSIPTHESINKYSEHLLAELEQLGHQSKKKETSTEAPKLKRFEETTKDRKESQEKKEGDDKGKEKSKCKFFLTDQGCRRGKGCTFSHDQKDDKRRCWNCGGVDHMATTCTRSKEGKEGGRPKTMKMEKEKNVKAEGEEDEGQPQLSVKDLLKEANDMLKSMQSPSSSSATSTSPKSDGERQEVVERLQQQLNALRLKTFRIKKMTKGERGGLLDSGATHPLRPARPGEDINTYEQVQVAIG